MTSDDALLQFAAELTVFLVSVVGVTFALRPRVLPSSPTNRSLLGAGFLAMGVAAFLHGALIVPDVSQPALVVLRVGGLVLVALGAPRPSRGDAGTWIGSGNRTATVLWAGLAVLAVAEVLVHLRPGPAVSVATIVGALLLGGALLSASRRSIGARIGADSAVLLLIVLLTVSVALSVVVSRNVEDEALRRYGNRGATEASAAVGRAEEALGVAKLVSGEVSGGLPADLTALNDPAASPEAKAAARQRLTEGLGKLLGPSFLDVSDPVVLVDPSGVPEAVAPARLDNTTRLALAGGPVAEEARRTQGPRQAVTVVGGRAYAVAATPVIVPQADAPQLYVGSVVVATPLDATYLRTVETGPEQLSLALVTPDRVVAQSGPQPSAARLKTAAAQVIDAGGRPSGVQGSRFVVARPVAATGTQPELALVVSVPTSAIESTRNDLFRALFVIALFAASIAVLLAVLAGERIGRSVRRLTVAAQRIRSGDLTTSVAVTSDDELGTLGATFDEMTGSLRQAEDMKTSFLANISHELRTPLTPIKGYTAAMRRRPPTPEQAELYADEISSGVDQLERIIGQLVNFATMAAGRLDLRTGQVGSTGLLEGVVERWSERAGTDHPLRVEVADGAEALDIDRGYIDQALDELVDNALKYSPGGGAVMLSAERDTHGVWLSVSDEGVGMDPEAVERLVMEFAQADGSATREFGGLGLGLALVDRIARAHGGELRCRSQVGSGTVVSIRVPFGHVDREVVVR